MVFSGFNRGFREVARVYFDTNEAPNKHKFDWLDHASRDISLVCNLHSVTTHNTYIYHLLEMDERQ